ncbi:hypothetical protein CHU92_00205 [Flavobacterium cyanobacteriorum]|uniref:Uncharacterized protein n=1 Tax=Flavobacterium cyanobacteriorum TaxID=2022802 RepID=A0A256A9Y0_9FLAO|nr:hypothetical protein [Flavobacterium cyanobacteriorum]OYQ50015.1 hypothetical protein CHU92_00205 [Flavobacterium cyanobacteriorum]
MSKTIEIKKVHIRNLLISFILGFGILFGLEHFGKFSYIADSPNQNNYEKPSLVQYVPSNTKVLRIYFDSYFNNRIETAGNGFDLYDMSYANTDFKKYSVKSYYYTKATIKDYKFGVYISLTLFIITLFFTNFKIKLT